FSLCKGVSVMEYIRGRRLSLAAIELYGWHINIVTPELARETIESFKVRGTIKAPSDVQEVLNKLINTI
ncbi:MAG: hypothetical protein GX053_14475, partial [Tissierella sp.]|nr:hypothetical protein [Tissierella sp.]